MLVHSFFAGVDFSCSFCRVCLCIVLDKFDDRVLLYDFSSHVTNKVIVQLYWTNCIPLGSIHLLFLSCKYLSPFLHLSLSLSLSLSLVTCVHHLNLSAIIFPQTIFRSLRDLESTSSPIHWLLLATSSAEGALEEDRSRVPNLPRNRSPNHLELRPNQRNVLLLIPQSHRLD